MIGSLDVLQDELLSLIATSDMLDKSDKSQMATWLKSGEQASDLAINAVSLGKANKSKYQNYLSS